MHNIVLIGAGQLGSRHLQGLAQLKNINIQVVDASQIALDTAKQRFEEITGLFNGKISYYTQLSLVNKNIDVAIIATNSSVRRLIIEDLIKVADVKNLILEKFLFTKISDYSIINDLIKKHKINTWVNCPRRVVGYYQKLKSKLTTPFTFSVSGNAWGLGCNGIHFLDLFSFLSNSSELIIQNTLIDSEIQQSKRNGYIEFTGTIIGSADRNSFSISSFNAEPSGVLIEINSSNVRYVIEEGSTSKVKFALLENNWQWQEETFQIPFQSQLTNVIVDGILNSGNCKLTTYSESSKIHQTYLHALISFLQHNKHDNTINECLIT